MIPYTFVIPLQHYHHLTFIARILYESLLKYYVLI